MLCCKWTRLSDFIDLLKIRHAIIDQIDEVQKITPLEFAIEKKSLAAVEALLHAGANPYFTILCKGEELLSIWQLLPAKPPF